MASTRGMVGGQPDVCCWMGWVDRGWWMVGPVTILVLGLAGCTGSEAIASVRLTSDGRPWPAQRGAVLRISVPLAMKFGRFIPS